MMLTGGAACYLALEGVARGEAFGWLQLKAFS